MADKITSTTSSEIIQKIAAISDSSTSLETKKSDVELMLNFCMKNDDFIMCVKENNGILAFITEYKNTNDLKLKVRLSTLLYFLSLSGEFGDKGVLALNLMNEVNVLSLVNLFSEKDYCVFAQAFGGLKLLGEMFLKQASGSNSPPSAISFNLSAAIRFLESIIALVDPSSTVLSDSQKVEVLTNFTQFVLTGVMAQAAEDAAKDTSAPLSRSFSEAYGRLVKALEGCRKGDFSTLDMVVAQILLLVKDGKLIAAMGGLSDNLSIISKWIGGDKKFNLLYKAEKDGFAGATFHAKCDGKGATVTIVTSSEGWVFGGYTPLSWNAASNNYATDSSNQSFIFSLKNPRDEKPAKFGLSNSSRAIYCNNGYGPTFGGNHDIVCYNNANSASNYTHLGGNYSNTTGLDGQTFFTGKYNYTAKDIEVYQVV